jgi:chemotaxis protein methyltransferase CheR
MALMPAPPADAFAMRPQDFDQIRQLVYAFCGVDLHGKQVLVGTRLAKKVREMGFPSFAAYCAALKQNSSSDVFTETIDALTTNHTSFFREEAHFHFLQQVVLPPLSPAAEVSIWSAACSTGEEPYTIAFSLIDALGDAAFSRASILATDISTRVLEEAQRALYPVERLKKQLSPELMRRCLLRGTGDYTGHCLVKPEVRKLIHFRQFNLLDDCSSFGPFQVIFCRNVMIYFDRPTQQRVVNSLAARLVPGGYLFIGHSESLNGIEHPLTYVRPATYRMGPAPRGAATMLRSSKGAH